MRYGSNGLRPSTAGHRLFNPYVSRPGVQVEMKSAAVHGSAQVAFPDRALDCNLTVSVDGS